MNPRPKVLYKAFYILSCVYLEILFLSRRPTGFQETSYLKSRSLLSNPTESQPMLNDVAAGFTPHSPLASCCNSLALSSQSVSFVVCDYLDSVFYELLKTRYARICFATPVETKVAPK